MPRQSVDYSKTIIYKIVCKDLSVTDVYVGHTTDFKSRKSKHKIDCNNEKRRNHNCKVYKFIRENGGFENFDIIVIEKFTECKDSNEATSRERYWYEQLNAKLNSIRPQITKEERMEYINQYNKEHKEDKQIYDKAYNQKHKLETNEKCKRYYEENKEKIKEQKKQYNINRKNTPYICPCGWIGNKINKWHHINTSLKHKNYLENQT